MLKRFSYMLGYSLRESGQALDRVGCSLQGNYAFKEQLNRHRRIMSLYNKKPAISNDVFVAPNATVIGNVTLEEGASVWYGAILRGDVNSINVGKKSSIGNRTVVHVSSGESTGVAAPTNIGNNVIVGDGAILHACTLEDSCIIENGAVVLDGVVVEKNAVVGPGAVVTKGKRVLSGQYWEGNPAKHIRNLDENEKQRISQQVTHFYEHAKIHEEESLKTAEQKELDIVLEENSSPYKPGTILRE